jgi:hypothetical protein
MLWNENGRGKNKILRISRQPFSLQIKVDKKQLKNVEYFNYVCSMTTKNASFTREIKSGIAIQQKEASFHQEIGFK